MSTATPTSPGASTRPAPQAPSPGRRRSRLLRRYRDGDGTKRELLARPGAHGTVLVVDRTPLSGDEERLVAHLASDEPPHNAVLAVEQYLAAEPGQRRCRALQPADGRAVPLPAPDPLETPGARVGDPVRAPDGSCGFSLRLVPSGMSIPALRWTRAPRRGEPGAATPMSLREAVATLQSYQPLTELTRAALTCHEDDQAVSTTVLRAELRRVLDSPIVLNRALREAVLAKVSRGEASMSEIAMRCGRLKRDSKGHTTGETSWLARRVGLLPEGGHSEPTRWVHSDVLALIARQGLGIAPREVELG